MKGIDFGTSTSFLAESANSRIEIISLGRSKGKNYIPTIAGFDGDSYFVGWDAEHLAAHQIIRSVKRTITRRLNTVPISDGTQTVELSADEVITSVLTRIAEIAEYEFVSLNDPGDIRLGCPAMWDGSQRQRLIERANEAGIPIGENTVIDEPIAAAVAWVTKRVEAGDFIRGKVLVFDMGGGTLDVAVVDAFAEPHREIMLTVQAAVGIDEAGDQLDSQIAQELKDLYSSQGFDFSEHDSEELEGWILAAAREAKESLSFADTTTVYVGHPTIQFPTVQYSRDQLETHFRAQLSKAISQVWYCLQTALMTEVKGPSKQRSLTPSVVAKIPVEDLAKGIDYVVLAGGMAQIPAIRAEFASLFPNATLWLGDSPADVQTQVDTAELIARGLANGDSYEQMNLHRPGFDFVLEWEDEKTGETQERVIYSAYSPLYSREFAFERDMTKFYWKAKDQGLPTKGSGRIKIRSMNGTSVKLKREQVESDYIDFKFGFDVNNSVVTLEPNGRIFVLDTFGHQGELRVGRWPVIRAAGEVSWLIVEPHPQESHVHELVWHQKD